MTLNLGLLALRPLGLRGLSFAGHVDRRLAAAPDHLHGCGADVIALQEVYARPHGRFLRKRLLASYPHACVPRKLRSILGSGLMFLSRYPIVSSEFFPWRGAPIENAVSAKGCLYVAVDIPGYGPLGLLNLHLSVGGVLRRPNQSNANARQLAEIDQVLKVANLLSSVPPILIGDFNCSPVVNPEVYRRIVGAGFVDAFAATATSEQKESPVTWDPANPLNAGGPHRHAPSQRIDHVFVPSILATTFTPTLSSIEFRKPTIDVGRGRTVTLSDHYALFQRLALNMKGATTRVESHNLFSLLKEDELVDV
jgi:endonuclease/exonuclease/phosphatase family metal-dependent hydrolase